MNILNSLSFFCRQGKPKRIFRFRSGIQGAFIMCCLTVGLSAQIEPHVDITATNVTTQEDGIVNLGDIFTIVVEVNPNGLPIDGAEVHLKFDPEIVQAVSATAVSPSPLPFPLVFLNIDNNEGVIDLGSGTFGNFPTELFQFLTVDFEVITDVEAEATVEFIDPPGASSTIATFGGANVLKSINGTTVSIEAVSFLPVELMFFDVSAIGDEALLEWSTASEINNDYFEIQRSQDGLDWTVLDYVIGNGTTSIQQDYEYRDENPLPGVNYYRLKQVDYDGSFAFSDVENAAFEVDIQELELFPNPVQSELSIKLPTVVGSTALRIYNMQGQLVGSYNMENRQALQSLNVSQLPSGTYNILVNTSNNNYTARFVKR